MGREEVERGQVLAKPNSITPHTEFMGEVYVLRKEEGGRHKAFFPGYRPQFYIRTMDVTGEILSLIHIWHQEHLVDALARPGFGSGPLASQQQHARTKGFGGG